MNIQLLFELQRKLQAYIVSSRNLHGDKLLTLNKLGFLGELGELSNEFGGFKYWIEQPSGTPNIPEPDGGPSPLLNEYVDALHFMLVIGLDILTDEEISEVVPDHIMKNSLETQFLYLFSSTEGITTRNDWAQAFGHFLGLGEMLGLTKDDIQGSYLEKYHVNLQREAD